MSNPLAVAVLSGLTLGFGLWLLLSLLPRFARPGLLSRVAPYVLDLSPEARNLAHRSTANPLPVFGLLFRPVEQKTRRAIDAVLGGADSTARRLRQAGSILTLDEFRARQLAWSVAGCAIGVGASLAILYAGGSLTTCMGVIAISAVVGFLARDYVLKRRAAARVARLAKELPTLLEFMTLSLSAGEGILDALRRVAKISKGEMATELVTVLSEVNTGLPLGESLGRLAGQLELAPFSRAVDQIRGALERGTPLAEVLSAQAQDARDDAKRQLLETAGKKEVAMLVPLVFLILPVTIAFAIFPGIFVLQLEL